MHIVCPHCASINRVAAERLHDKPICGKCKNALLTGQPISLTDSNFSKVISQSDLPIVVDFWADWCGPCKMMAPQFAQAAQQMPQLIFAKVDTEASPKTSAAYAIRSIPSLILFKQGKEIARQAGAIQARDLMRWINSALEKVA
jgi:thioredoxin 2